MMEKLDKHNVRSHHRIVFLFVLSAFLASCLGWILEKPTVVLREVILSPRSLQETDILLGLEVQNPNRLDLTLKSFEYTIHLNKEEIGNGRLEKEFLLPSSCVTRIQATVTAKFKNLSGSLKAIITGDNLPYKIEGKADLKTALGSLSFPFSKEGHINLKMKIRK